MAAPHVAGAFALLSAAEPDASVDEKLAALQSSGIPVFDSRNGISKPRIQVDAALIAVGTGPVFYTVSASASAGGSITPSDDLRVEEYQSATFTVTPQQGYVVQTVTGCSGTLVGSIYTTGPIIVACSVSAQFRLIVTSPGVEVEINDSAAQANALSSGQVMRGSLISQSDQDYFSIATGSSGTLDIIFSGYPSAPYEILNPSLEVIATGDIYGSSTKSIGVSQTGNYYIRVYGDSNSDSEQYQITATYFGAVPSPPSAPQITGIEPGDAQVAISVSVAYDGGSPVTGYVIACLGDRIVYGTSPTSPILVSGLTNGVTYQCLGSVTNAVGSSPNSELSAAFTPVGFGLVEVDLTSDLAGSAGSESVFSLYVPPGATGISFAMSGGTGDADLYVKFGAPPTLDNFDCRPYVDGNIESCPGSLSGGTYYFTVVGFADFAGVNLMASYRSDAVPPSAPQITGIDPGDTQASISVSVADDGGSPITEYTVLCVNANLLGFGNTSPTSPITISGLTNGETYACRATATNDVGTSPVSEASAPFTLATAPSMPEITSIEPGDTQVSINVSVADDGGSPITGYVIACLGDRIIYGTSPTTPIMVSGLINGVTYQCLGSVTNAVGSSPNSELSAAFTPVAPPPGC